MPKDGKEAVEGRKKVWPGRRVGRGVGKGQQSKESDRRVKEGKSVSPGDVGREIRGSSWVELNMVAKVCVVRSSSRSQLFAW